MTDPVREPTHWAPQACTAHHGCACAGESTIGDASEGDDNPDAPGGTGDGYASTEVDEEYKNDAEEEADEHADAGTTFLY